jgi:glycosyltransferase involved in cell wall biosynthesis
MTFHGEVPDAAAFLQTCGIMAVPLLSGGGMRLKVIEAMAAGMCVVTTPLGAEGIRCTPGTDILVADGAADFTEALLLVSRNPGEAALMGKAARETALREYGWPGLVQKFVTFYRQLISASNV